jgi:L-lactate dehydrogenase complex protein LldG
VSAREAILAAVRRAAVPAVELPELPAVWPGAPTRELLDISYFAEGASQPVAAVGRAAVPAAAAGDAELVRRFCAMLEEVGGRGVELSGPEALAAAVAELPAARAAVAAAAPRGATEGRGIVSSVPGLAISTLTLGAEPSRESLDRIEMAVIPGRFGVAENGAVWVDEADVPHRAVPFVAQHLAIVLPRGALVADMHAAYRRLPLAMPGYGVFISGPSKTADIEQALVIGAQGPKSLVVFLV